MKWSKWSILILVLMVGAGLAACSDEKDKKSDQGGLVIKNAWVRPTTAQTDSGSMGDMESSGEVIGAFMVIENTSDQAERLISASVSADIAEMVEIHETTVDENNVMKMRPVEGIDVPAKGSAELKPGGYHIMLLNVKKVLNPGDKLSLTLTFASGQTLTVEAEVRAMEG